ncbi:MAG: hypothetical protein HYU75_07475 [Betaproteobacteria bacterium]|nr:hypothetical protein [Betaproteobacteria bacterium]
MMKRIVAVLLPLAVLSACGGGGGGGGSDGGSASSALSSPPSSFSSGAISGFGSVIVNGTHWSDGAGVEITVDDERVTRDDLRVGMVAEVEGTANGDGTGNATRIRVQNLVRGPVDSVNASAGTLVVLGQPVRANGAAVFEDVEDLSGIAPGDIVEVSGWFENLDPAQTNTIVARRIQEKSPNFGGPLKVRGLVKNLDSAQRTFNINNLVVDFGSAQIQGSSASALQNGLFVDVRAQARPVPLGGTLIADSVRVTEPKPAPAEGARVEVEGIISDLDPVAMTFTVAGIRVDASARGVSGLANGMKVEVEGTIVNGVLVLAADEEVEREMEADVKFEALVQATDVAGGTLTLLGKPIQVRATTQFVDQALKLRTFGLADIQPGDSLRVRAFEDANGDVVAVKVIRRDPPLQKVILQGRMDTKDPATSSLTILGIRVQGGPDTEWELRETRVDAATWFAGTALNAIVKAAGAEGSDGNSIDATGGEVETEEDAPVTTTTTSTTTTTAQTTTTTVTSTATTTTTTTM